MWGQLYEVFISSRYLIAFPASPEGTTGGETEQPGMKWKININLKGQAVHNVVHDLTDHILC